MNFKKWNTGQPWKHDHPRWWSCFFVVLLIASLCVTAYAAWDGSGSTGGNTNVSVSTGGFVLVNADANDIYGYRFTVYDADGNKLGYSVDILRKAETRATKRSIQQKSHIDLYDEYYGSKSADLGSLASIQVTGNNASYGIYYDTSLPATPTSVETWLTETRARQVAKYCEADDFGTSSTNYIICEPLFQAVLENEYWCATMAEYAVYQSGQYGWTSVPGWSTTNTYSQIMRPLSGYYGRYLYATGQYDAFHTSPTPSSALKTDGNGTASVLLPHGNSYFNTAADILQYQVGMAVYSDKIPLWTLTIDPNGGSYKGSTSKTSISIIENAKMEISDPTRQGYSFTGWSISNSKCSLSGKTYTQGEGNCTLTANWTPAGDTPYKVNHYKMNTSGSYPSTPTETENLTGSTGASVTPSVKSYTGFTSPATQTVTIKADGSTVVNYYYSRNQYTVTLNKGTGISSVSGAGTYYYGQSVTINATVSSGYSWSQWSGTHSTATKQYSFSMPAYNVTDTANATADTPEEPEPEPEAAYTVKHWLEDLDLDGYTLEDTETFTATTGDSVTPAVKSYTGFTAPSTKTVIVKADGSTVVNYYYERNSYTVTLRKGTGISSVSGSGTYLYGESVTIKATVSTGYSWSKWSGGISTTTRNYSFTMPAQNISATANATPNVYTITLDKQSGSGGTSKFYEKYGVKFYTNTSTQTAVDSISVPTRVGYTFGGYYRYTNGSGTQIIDSDGDILVSDTYFTANTTIYAHWIPNPDTPYTINHYRMDLNGNYPSTPYSTEQLTGTTDSTLILSQLANSYTGFSYSHGKVNGVTVTTTTIAPDGSRVIDLYYSRNKYIVTVNKSQGISGVSGGGTYYYGASVTIDATVATKYTWYRWTGTHTTYTQRYTFTMPAYNVTDTANAEPVLELEPINPNAAYRESTEVISAFRVINPSVISYTGAEDVTVTFQVKNSTTGAVIYIATEDTVIIPAGEEGLLYVKWTVPASVSGNAVTVTATIQKGSIVWTVATLTNSISDFLTGTTPDTDYEDSKPGGWVHGAQDLDEPGTASWEEWVYENGSFRKVSYTMTASLTAVITPGTGETHWLENGQWHMRSGYGICAQVQAVISASGVPVDAYTQAQYVQASFPEFSYSWNTGKIAVLSKYSGGWQFVLTEYGNYHFTPVWFPDGAYAVTFYASDLWTPVGVVSATKSSAPIIIDGNMYDDWYVGRP